MTTATYSDTLTAPPTVPPAERGHRRSGRFARRPGEPRWARPSLAGLLVATAALYLWGLGASGYANAFYSAAVQAGSSSWKAFFFGSLDAANSITVDKPPASLWVMDLSARIFGVNAWSILVPQALEGVAAVGLLYATVRRRFGPAAGLVAGAVLALTPVATLMFRFDNPDALLVLVLVGAAYGLVRALEGARAARWLVLAGALIGLGFLTKMLQAFLVVPGFALVYLVAAPVSVRRRVTGLLAGLVAMIVSAGWWIAAVALWPAASRPYIGGSQSNSILELVFGYNGFGRLTGNETGSVGGGGTTATGQWGATGLTRLFTSEMGGQISWLIPSALVLLGGMLWVTRRAARTDGARAQVLLWGTWLVVTGLTFSLAKGIIHPYYTVALAPAIGGLVGIGSVALWHRRNELSSRLVLAGALGAAAVWSYVLLGRTPSWHPALRVSVLVVGVVAALGLLALPWLDRRVALVVAGAALVVGLAGPAAYALDTAATTHTGAIPSAGPAVAGGMGGGARGGTGGGGGFGGGRPGGGTAPAPTQGGTGTAPGGTAAGGTTTRGGTATGGGGAGGLLDAATPSPALRTLLEKNASSYTWIVATVGANNAAGIQLATGDPVMAIGGFNGTDPSPTLAQFTAYVAAGRIHYFVGGSSVGGASSGTSSAIAAWVAANYTATTVGGQTVYDLTTG